MNFRLALAAARYLCQHRSVGTYRLVDDLLRDPNLLPAFAEVGAVEVVGGAPMAPGPGTPEWWKAYSAVKDALLYLEARGVVKYLPRFEAVNWIGRPCGSPTPAATPPPGSSATTAGGVQKGGRKRRTLVDYL
jgi:hypothetical protein